MLILEVFEQEGQPKHESGSNFRSYTVAPRTTISVAKECHAGTVQGKARREVQIMCKVPDSAGGRD